MKILMIVAWDIAAVKRDDPTRQSANLLINGQRYWFFKYWPVKDAAVDVIGHKKIPVVDSIEKRWLKFHMLHPLLFFPRTLKYDLVLCFHSQVGMTLAFLRRLFRIKLPPFVLMDVEGLGRKDRPWQRKLIKIALPSVSRIFYFASVQKDQYLKNFPEIKEKIRMIPFGIDLSRYMPQAVDPEDYIVSIGHQGPDFRDWKTLIKAFRLLNTKTRLMIVGKDSFSLADTEGETVSDNVEFKGKMNLADLNTLVLKSKFVVLSFPERYHAFGQMTLLGCMALGKAVIVSKVSGVIDYVENGKDVLFSRPYDAKDMKDKIESLLNDSGKALAIGENAKRTVESKFTEEIMAKNIFNSIFEMK